MSIQFQALVITGGAMWLLLGIIGILSYRERKQLQREAEAAKAYDALARDHEDGLI